MNEVQVVLDQIGSRVYAERKARNISKRALSERVGLHLNALKRIEDGGGCYLTTLIRMANALDMSLGELLAEDWTPPKRRPTLTPRQTIVLEAVIEGGSLAEVGKRIGVSGSTVGSALSTIYTRFGIRHTFEYRDERRAAAIRIARTHGLISKGSDDETNG